jgi:hypothetical protein
VNTEEKRYKTFPLRLPPSLRRQSTEFAELEGLSLNHFISMAVAEKISRMELSAAHIAPATPERRTTLAIVPRS